MSDVKIGCITLVRHRGKIAAIQCAKGRGTIMPGGKWEQGETFIQAAKRELFEETGLSGQDFRLVFHAMSEEGFYTYVFTATVDDMLMVSSLEGKVVWATWDDLKDSKFGAFYELLHQHLGW